MKYLYILNYIKSLFVFKLNEMDEEDIMSGWTYNNIEYFLDKREIVSWWENKFPVDKKLGRVVWFDIPKWTQFIVSESHIPQSLTLTVTDYPSIRFIVSEFEMNSMKYSLISEKQDKIADVVSNQVEEWSSWVNKIV